MKAEFGSCKGTLNCRTPLEEGRKELRGKSKGSKTQCPSDKTINVSTPRFNGKQIAKQIQARVMARLWGR